MIRRIGTAHEKEGSSMSVRGRRVFAIAASVIFAAAAGREA